MSRRLKQTLILRTTILKTLNSENEKIYCNVLNLWLRKRCTKDEFDLYVSKFLSHTGIQIHTKFLINLSRISCGLTAFPSINNSINTRIIKNVDNIMFHKFIDKTIPCASFCTARFFILAWEHGIISVETKLGKLLNLALMHFLRDIIFTLVSIKRSYRVRTTSICNYNKTVNDSSLKLPHGFIRKNNLSINDLILTLKLKPGIVKMEFSKYIEQIINGPMVNNLATLFPL